MIRHRLLAFARVMVMVMVKVMRVTVMGQVQAKPWHHPTLHHFLPTASPTQNLGAPPRTPQRGLLAPLSPSGDEIRLRRKVSPRSRCLRSRMTRMTFRYPCPT